MPANTPGGLPYPLPTEPVAEGAAAIRALAEALEQNPAAHAYWTGGNQGPFGAGAPSPASFNAVRFDTHGMWSAANPTRLTCKKAGVYLIGGNWEWVPAGEGTYRQLSIYLNVSTIIAQVINPLIVSIPYARQQVTVARRLQVGDYLQLVGFHDRAAGAALAAVAEYSPVLWAARVPTLLGAGAALLRDEVGDTDNDGEPADDEPEQKDDE